MANTYAFTVVGGYVGVKKNSDGESSYPGGKFRFKVFNGGFRISSHLENSQNFDYSILTADTLTLDGVAVTGTDQQKVDALKAVFPKATSGGGVSSEDLAAAVADYITNNSEVFDSSPFQQWQVDGNDISNLNIGNVGVGTDSPSTIFEVSKTNAGALGPEITITNKGNATGDASAITFKSGDYSRAQILQTVVAGPSNQYSGNFSFRTKNSYAGSLLARIFIEGFSGKVGMGTESPSTILHIVTTEAFFAGGDGLKISDSGSGIKPAIFWMKDGVKAWYQILDGNDLVVGENSGGSAFSRAAFKEGGNFVIAGNITVGTCPEYADNAAAVTGGLSVGQIYRTGDNLKIVH